MPGLCLELRHNQKNAFFGVGAFFLEPDIMSNIHVNHLKSHHTTHNIPLLLFPGKRIYWFMKKSKKYISIQVIWDTFNNWACVKGSSTTIHTFKLQCCIHTSSSCLSLSMVWIHACNETVAGLSWQLWNADDPSLIVASCLFAIIFPLGPPTKSEWQLFPGQQILTWSTAVYDQ